MKLNFSISLFIIFIYLISDVVAGDLLLGKEIAAKVCSTCHGMDGQAKSGGN